MLLPSGRCPEALDMAVSETHCLSEWQLEGLEGE